MDVLMTMAGLPLDSALADYLRYIGGDFSHDPVGVLQDNLIQVPGLSSGSQTTFLTNHVRMALNFGRMMGFLLENPNFLSNLKDGDPIPFPYEQLKVNFNVELTTTSSFQPTENSIYSGLSFVDLTRVYQAPGTLVGFGPLIRLDLLGFDCTVVQLDPAQFPEDDEITFCACLDYERLMKAISFRKTQSATKKKGGPLNESIDLVHNFATSMVSIMTMQTLYIVGGYAYPTAHFLIRSIVNLLLTEISNAVHQYKEYARTVNWTEDQAVEHMTAIITKQSEEFLGGSDSLNRYVAPSVTDQLSGMIHSMVTKLMRGDVESVSQFLERDEVIKRFHTKRGLAEKKEREKAKLEMMKAGSGGLTETAKSKRAVITADEIRQELDF